MLIRGTKTQTVNICTVDGRAGDYEHVYGLPIAEDIEAADVAELADAAALHDWVLSRRGLEEQQSKGRSGRPVLPLVQIEADPHWRSSMTPSLRSWLARTCTASSTRCMPSSTSASRTTLYCERRLHSALVR